MTCHLSAGACRSEHIAPKLAEARQAGADFKARCPICGHNSFRVSAATKNRRLRHIWTCACHGRGTCPCSEAALRTALLRLEINRGCLGIYEGHLTKVVNQETARNIEQAARDILSSPGMRAADMRVVLAEALGYTIPEDHGEFVKFARSIGLSHGDAYRTAKRFCRPSDLVPLPGGGRANASYSQPASDAVKGSEVSAGHSVEPPTNLVEPAYQIGRTGKPDNHRSETVQGANVRSSNLVEQASAYKPDSMDAAIRVLRAGGLLNDDNVSRRRQGA